MSTEPPVTAARPPPPGAIVPARARVRTGPITLAPEDTHAAGNLLLTRAVVASVRTLGIDCCSHCGEPGATRRRDLCRPCYEDPEIREHYPAHAGAVDDDYQGEGAEPLELCFDEPRSASKIQVLQARASRHEKLFPEIEKRYWRRRHLARRGPVPRDRTTVEGGHDAS